MKSPTNKPATSSKVEATPLREMTDLKQIMAFVSKIVDPTRSRAKLIFSKKPSVKAKASVRPKTKQVRNKNAEIENDDYPPIIIEKSFLYRETAGSVLVIHEPNSHQIQEAREVKLSMDVREIAAICLRDSQIVSQLLETRQNTKRMLDRTIGTIFTGTKIDARQGELTSANIRSIELFLTSDEAITDPVLRRAFNILFEVQFARDSLGKDITVSGPKDPRPTTVELFKYLRDALERRQREDSDNGVYDLVLRPGVSFLGTHNGRSRKMNSLDLMLQYIRSAASTPLEKRDMLSDHFMSRQADTAVNDIIGKIKVAKSVRRVKPEISEAVRNNTLYSTNPNLYDSMSALISGGKRKK